MGTVSPTEPRMGRRLEFRAAVMRLELVEGPWLRNGCLLRERRSRARCRSEE
jgi:hypothetical protein